MELENKELVDEVKEPKVEHGNQVHQGLGGWGIPGEICNMKGI